jgi:hypothetical protein
VVLQHSFFLGGIYPILLGRWLLSSLFFWWLGLCFEQSVRQIEATAGACFRPMDHCRVLAGWTCWTFYEHDGHQRQEHNDQR